MYQYLSVWLGFCGETKSELGSLPSDKHVSISFALMDVESFFFFLLNSKLSCAAPSYVKLIKPLGFLPFLFLEKQLAN